MPDAESGQELVVAWRLWNMTATKLQSWTMGYEWRPGGNQALCLRNGTDRVWGARDICPRSPGRNCMCGFWGMWTLGRAVSLGRRASMSPARTVVGIIVVWGTVALHGDEGFRAEYASIGCLLTEPIWSPILDPFDSFSPSWVRNLHHIGMGLTDRRHREYLRRVSDRYGVPATSLGGALEKGVLAELGLTDEQMCEIRTRLGIAVG